MRILLVCTQGTFRYGHRGEIPNAEKPYYLAKNLADFGHEVTLIFQNPFAQKQLLKAAYQGLTILYLPDLTPPGLGKGHTFSRYALRGTEMVSRAILEFVLQFSYKFDMVHSFWPSYPENYFPLLLARHLRPAHTVIDFEDRMGGKEGLVNFLGDPSMRRFRLRLCTELESSSVRLADGAIGSTATMCDVYHELGLKRDRIFKIPRGVDVRLYRPIPTVLARRRFGLSDKSSIIGFLGGSLRQPEYLETLLQAFSILVQTQPDLKLLLIGGRMPVSLQSMIAKLDIASSVIITGAIELEEVPWYLSASNVLVLPLLDNILDTCRWPNRLLEYMACGRPVVTAKVGEAAEIVDEGRCGLVFRAGDSEDMAGRIRDIIENQSEAEGMGQRSRSKVEHDYTWSSVARSTEEAYFRILKSV